MPTSATPLHAVREALSGFIDYAGLFPPAQLPLDRAIAEYLTARNGPYSWMLGRFIAPLSVANEVIPRTEPVLRSETTKEGTPSYSEGSLRLSVIIDRSVSDLQKVSNLQIDALEVALAPDAIEKFAEETGRSGFDRLPRFVELPRSLSGEQLRAGFEKLERHGLGAKIRCGGVTADAMPSSESVAAFIGLATEAGVPFKATAGLHHPIRAYNKESGFTMHGFLNLLAAAALAHSGSTGDELVAALNDEEPSHFTFNAEAFIWKSHKFVAPVLNEIRSRRFLSYGSCSFDEPTADLRALGMIP